MREINTSKCTEIDVREFILVKIALLVMIFVYIILLIIKSNPANYINPFEDNPFYTTLEYKVIAKEYEKNEYTEITDITLTGINFLDKSMTEINIPTEVNIDYLCGSYKAPLSQMDHSVDEECLQKSISSLFNVTIDETLKTSELGDETIKAGKNIFQKKEYIEEVQKRTLNDIQDKLNKFPLEEWKILFALTGYDPSVVDEITTEEFQRLIITQNMEDYYYDVKTCKITADKIEVNEYEFPIMNNKTFQDCRDKLNMQVGMLATPFKESKFEFVDQYELKLWPIDAKFDNENPNDCGEIKCDGDEDLDGIMNNVDLCPYELGVLNNNGCPVLDSDGDGILDDIDSCPSEYAATRDGCPTLDSDGDGILDDVDSCPSEYAVTLDGCPILDSDGDGRLDSVDACPNEFGQTTNGCPEKVPEAPADPDRDKDGILNNVDSCPDEFAQTPDGCPEKVPEPPVDTDGDGVADINDSCASTPTGENVDFQGCSESQLPEQEHQ